MARAGIFIQTNAKQLLGAKIAKYAMETRGKARERGIPVTLLEVEQIPAFQRFVGRPYRQGRTYTFDDLQSFTLTRFMPPEEMHYEGRALVIDPDIFALADIGPLFERDLEGAAIACCPKFDEPNGVWDSSMMVLENAKLRHWNISAMLEEIATGMRSYEKVSRLEGEPVSILALPREWNSLDLLTPETKMLHTTERLTQPWKTGLPIDFRRNRMKKMLGIIPREPFLALLGRYPTRYERHPDPRVEALFFELARAARADGAITDADIQTAVASRAVRPDFSARLTAS